MCSPPAVGAFVSAALAVLVLLPASPARGSSLDDMISPVSMPTVNEDPRVDTELRPMYMYTKISNDFVTDGGNYSVVAAQARFALTDRIAFIATKDGYIFLNPDKVVDSADGWANLAFGARYRVTDTIDVGAVGELPVTERHDILGWRVTSDVIWRPMGWNAIF